LGRVQGVFYRDSVRRIASERGVAGSAVNRADGSVEVVLEGARGDVEAVHAFCAIGPRGASVSDLEVVAEEPRGEVGFAVG